MVYSVVGALTLASFLFFALVPLPRAYYPEWIIGRPEDLIPGLFFLLALIGYLRTGQWKTDLFMSYLVLSILTGLGGAGRLYDVLARVVRCVFQRGASVEACQLHPDAHRLAR